MISNAAFHANFSLAVLQTQLNAFVPLWGGLTAIGNQDGDTIGVYDTTAPTVSIRLRPGSAAAAPGERVLATGQVYIVNQLQTVTAYG